MKTIERVTGTGTAAVPSKTQRTVQDKSLVQWLFNPYSVCDTTNWSVSTGVGKLAIGGLTRVVNEVILETPNKSKHNAYSSTADFEGYKETVRYAYHIAAEIEGAFPKRVRRVRTLEGNERGDAIAEVLLGSQMAVAEIEGSADYVPVLTEMLKTLRSNLTGIKASASEQKELLLAAGRELETIISDNIKLAIDDLKLPQQEVASGKKTGFDNNARRNFLALGRPVPELKLASGDSAEVNDKLATALDKLSNLLGSAEEKLPADFISDKDADEILADTEQVWATAGVTYDEQDAAAQVTGKCQATTSSNKPCKNDAKDGAFCAVHQ